MTIVVALSILLSMIPAHPTVPTVPSNTLRRMLQICDEHTATHDSQFTLEQTHPGGEWRVKDGDRVMAYARLRSDALAFVIALRLCLDPSKEAK